MEIEPTKDTENKASPQPTLAEMTQRRFLVVSTPTGSDMRSYYQLKLLEGTRAGARRSYSKPLDLWNRFLNLFGLAFSRAYERDRPTTATESKAQSVELIEPDRDFVEIFTKGAFGHRTQIRITSPS